MNEVSAEQLLMIIGEQAVEIKILRIELTRLQQQQNGKTVKEEK